MDFLAALGRTWNDAFMLSQVPIPDSDDVLDLEPTADGFGDAVSIGRARNDGSMAWSALPPGGAPHDVWTDVRLDGQRVRAHSWSCYEVVLDLESGRKIMRTFVKQSAIFHNRVPPTTLLALIDLPLLPRWSLVPMTARRDIRQVSTKLDAVVRVGLTCRVAA
jgi:hypothetical protein